MIAFSSSFLELISIPRHGFQKCCSAWRICLILSLFLVLGNNSQSSQSSGNYFLSSSLPASFIEFALATSKKEWVWQRPVNQWHVNMVGVSRPMGALCDKQAGSGEKTITWSLQSSLQVAADQLYWTQPLSSQYLLSFFVFCNLFLDIKHQL